MININSWNGWDPLKTCLLGSSLPNDWFDTVPDKNIANGMRQIMEETNEDLDNFKSELNKRGVKVVELSNRFFKNTFQEFYESYREDDDGRFHEKFMQTKIGIPRPSLSPRDWLIVMGDHLLSTTPNVERTPDDFLSQVPKDKFSAVPDSGFVRNGKEYHGGFGAPYVTRLGTDIIVDEEDIRGLGKFYEKNFPNFNVRTITCGGHNDSCFATLKPGWVLCADRDYFQYDLSFPEWEVAYIPEIIQIDLPKNWKDWNKTKNAGQLGNYWVAGMSENPAAAKFINDWLSEWVGFAEETIFEVNVLTINPECVMGISKDPTMKKYIEDTVGMEYVHVPFRHRWFWDGGLHCLTVDLEREGGQQSYIDAKYAESKWL